MRRKQRLRYLLVHDLDHVEAAAKIGTRWRSPLLMTQNVKVRVALASDGVDCLWALPGDWAPTHSVARDLTEQLLTLTYQDFGNRVADSLGVWRRANHFRFLHIATAFLAAQECIGHLRRTVGDLSKLGVVINPEYFTTLHAYLPGSAFAFILKALAPEIAYVDFKTGEPLADDAVLGLKIGVELLESTPPAQIQPADALVLPFGIKDRWQDFVDPQRPVATVATMFRIPSDYALGSSVRTPDYPMPLTAIKARPTVDDLLVLYRPVLTQLWMPRLESLRNDCAEFLARAQPRQLVVCDHTFPESAFLAAERPSGTTLTILTHDIAGVDVSLWDPEPNMEVFVGTHRAKLKWANAGTDAHIDERSYAALRVSRDVRPPRNEGERLRILAVGTGDHVDAYPLVPAGDMARSLPAVLQVPPALRDRIELIVKPRPGQKTGQQYEAFADIDQLVPEGTPLPNVLPDIDVAVVIEQTSAAVVEAIAAGCLVLGVGCEPGAESWNRSLDQSGLFNREVVPVLHPDEFWSQIATLLDDPTEFESARAKQVDWLRDELATERTGADV